MGKDKRKQEDLFALGVCFRNLAYLLSDVMYSCELCKVLDT